MLRAKLSNVTDGFRVIKPYQSKMVPTEDDSTNLSSLMSQLTRKITELSEVSQNIDALKRDVMV